MLKKKASFISLDSSLIKWLRDKLRFGSLESQNSNELLEGLEDLISGQVTTLILDMNEQEQTSVSPIDNGICCGNLEIYPNSRTVIRNGFEIPLTPKEFDILFFLARNRGDVFTKEQIYQAVWEEDYLLADSNIMAFIRKLRKKIEPNPDAPEYIITIWGIGYKFNDKL